MANYPDMKIFLVDDDIFCLSLYEQFLRNLGYSNITAFNSGDECLEQLKEKPDLIFLDYNMEGMNGIDVLKAIKANTPDILVYIISGQESTQVAAEAIQHGAINYLVKSSLSPEKMPAVMAQAETFYVPQNNQRIKRSFFDKVKSGLGI